MSATRVAEIAAEWSLSDRIAEGDREGGIQFQPVGVRLDNDGCLRFWLDYGNNQRWTLNHDGVGWRAERQIEDGHIRRLADESGPKDTFISWLPAAGGQRIELVPGTSYEVALTSNDELTRAAVYLSILG